MKKSLFIAILATFIGALSASFQILSCEDVLKLERRVQGIICDNGELKAFAKDDFRTRRNNAEGATIGSATLASVCYLQQSANYLREHISNSQATAKAYGQKQYTKMHI